MKVKLLGSAMVVFVFMPSLRADDAKKAQVKTYQIPYRLTNTKHVLIRAKINDKGPFNFIMDTGAPALFVSTALCAKLGIEPDKKGWGTFDRLAIEGGLVIAKARGRIEDPFQLEGINGLGLAGVELHGVIGYNILARYRMELDFTKDKMAWTALDFEPPAPEGLGGKGAAGVDAMAGLMKLAVVFLGNKPKPEVSPRGFLGIELADGGETATVKSVLTQGPAAGAGLQAGDCITHFQDKEVKTAADLRRLADKIMANDTIKLTVTRNGQSRKIAIKAGEGL